MELVVVSLAAAFVLNLLVRGIAPKKTKEPVFLKGMVADGVYWSVARADDGTFRVGRWIEKEKYAYGEERFKTFEHAEKFVMAKEPAKPKT